MIPYCALCLVALLACNAHAYTSCKNGDDCGSRECCLDVGAAIAQGVITTADGSNGDGVCVAMGGVAAKCHVAAGYAWHKPHDLVTMCPCRTGLICGPVKAYDQFGQRGYCSFG